MNPYFKLLRPKQWYKNFVIFLPMIFAQQLFNFVAIEKTLLGFIALCLVSSANYVINDIVDREKDKNNPEKKHRPIASGKVKVLEAIIIAIVLLLGSIFLSLNISIPFLVFVFFLFLSTQSYSFFLKNEPFIDILMISINFVARTVSGAFVLTVGFLPYVEVSQWLILCPFFLALFLAVGKRSSEGNFLDSHAKKHRKTLGFYTKEVTSALIIISTTLLIFSYAMYTFFSQFKMLMLTLPPVLYLVFRFFYYIEKGEKISRHPEMLYKDFRMILALVLTGIIAFISIYIL